MERMSNFIFILYYLQHGETALHMAASGGHLEIVKYLHEKGSNIHATDKVSSILIHFVPHLYFNEHP